MKTKILSLVIVLMALVHVGHGQCSINTSITRPLFYPDSTQVPCIERGVPYSFDLQFKCPDSLALLGLPITFIVIDSIIGLPTGIGFNTNFPGGVPNKIFGGDNGCIHFSGTTNEISSIFPIRIHATINSLQGSLFSTQITGLPPRDATFSLDSIHAPKYFFTLIDSGGLCFANTGNSAQIKGKVYYDINGNGIYDGGDIPFANSEIEISPVPFIVYTNINGEYTLYTSAQNVSLSINTPQYFSVSSNATLNYNNLQPFQVITNADFGLVADTIIHDVSVSVTQSPARPGFTTTMWIDLQNNGTQFENGTVQLTYDSLLTYVLSSIAFSSHTNNVLEFPYANLSPGEQRSIHVQFTVPVDVNLIGDSLLSYAGMYNQMNEMNEENNYDSLNQIITGSYDPNDKNYSPFNKIFKEGVALGDDITYTIRFQNTGTDTAFTVVIVDTLDKNVFDLTTFKPIGSSHTYNLKLNDNGELSWTFNNILLPDSGVNEPGSHGYVKFSVAIKNNLAHQTLIENTAAIYFDFNPPIITNTATTKVNIYLSTEDLMAQVVGLKIYPNPASQTINIEMENGQYSIKKIMMFDITGRAVSTNNTPQPPSRGDSSALIDVSGLSNGLYFLHVEMSNGQRVVRKVVKE
jgi:uncharacterized repeat protein (TIGR01451 family)